MTSSFIQVLAEEKEMEAIAAPAEPSPTKKSANGVGVKSTANGTNGAADGDKKGKIDG